jgi:hypothetical protein
MRYLQPLWMLVWLAACGGGLGGRAPAGEAAVGLTGDQVLPILPFSASQVPSGIAADRSGNVFVLYGAAVYKITGSGATVLATLPSACKIVLPYESAGGVSPLVLDRSGNLLLACNSVVYQVTPDGVASVLAGGAAQNGVTPVDGTGSAAGFGWLTGMSRPDASGNVYLVDGGYNPKGYVGLYGVPGTHIDWYERQITSAGVVSTVKRYGTTEYSGVYVGTAMGASYFFGIYDWCGIEDSSFTPAVGAAEPDCGAQDGVGTSARFSSPSSLAVDSSGNTYVADTGNNTLRKFIYNTKTKQYVVSTVAGVAGARSTSVDGTGSAARFSQPFAVASDGIDQYVVDAGMPLQQGGMYHSQAAIRKVTAAGVVSTLAVALCPGGSAACGNTCVNLQSNVNHCGACG